MSRSLRVLLCLPLAALLACSSGTDKDDEDPAGDDGADGGGDDGGGEAEEVDFDGDGFLASEGDCNDTDAAVFPGAEESCNEVDDDCDGDIDEEVETTWYQDADGDGFGNAAAGVEACEQPDQMVADDSDCDDLDAAVFPGADELCNAVDDDCDGDIDEEATDGGPWYFDLDGDGFGDPESWSTDCEAASDTVEDATDCDDGDAEVFPGSTATETPGDGVDTDCDGLDACTDATCDGVPDLFSVNYWGTDGGYDDSELWLYSGADFLDDDRILVDSQSAWTAEADDLDADGYPDLVVSSSYESGTRYVDAFVYWGSASGYSGADSTALPVIGSVRSLIDDLDGDGWLDIFFANASTGGNSGYHLDSYIYWGSSAGFSESDRTDLPTSGAWEMASGDFDGDGLTDLVVCEYYDDSTGERYDVDSTIWWGDGSRFSTATTSDLPTSGCRAVEAADFDGDGLTDLAFANSYSNSVWDWQIDSVVYMNDGARFAAPESTGLPTSFTYGMTTGDADGDGDIDIVYGNLWGDEGYESETVVYLNDGSGGFSADDTCSLPSMGAYDVYLEDLDDDGYNELIVPSSWDDDSDNETWSQIFWGGPDAYCVCDVTELPTLAPGKASFGDLDGDGDTDVVFPSPSYGAYDSEAVIYWNMEGEFTEDDATWFAGGAGSWGAPVIIGG